ncbi:hypothetical protein BGZ58_002260, partial [Dissophora ornata]
MANPKNLIIKSEKGVNTLVTINKAAGTFDVVHADDPDATCIGVRARNRCVE